MVLFKLQNCNPLLFAGNIRAAPFYPIRAYRVIILAKPL